MFINLLVLSILLIIYDVYGGKIYENVGTCDNPCSINLSGLDSVFKVKGVINNICADTSGLSTTQYNIEGSITSSSATLYLLLRTESSDYIFSIGM